MKAQEVMEQVTAQLVAKMEAGAGTWEMPWRTLGTTGFPRNAITKVNYRGGNVLVLAFTAMEKGYQSNDWATFKQWQGAGAMVRKGERGTHLLFWQPSKNKAPDTITVKDENTGEDVTLTAMPKGGAFAKTFVVFHRDQVDNAPAIDDADKPAPMNAPQRLAYLEAWFDAIPAWVSWGGDRACYSPELDRVLMPGWEQFDTTDHGYATLVHELAHWTGHKDRLGRVYGKRFGDEAYAAEELVAELSSAFTCAVIGMETVERTDHAAYLSHWCAMLKADPGILWSVASKAQAATEHLCGYVTATASTSRELVTA